MAHKESYGSGRALARERQRQAWQLYLAGETSARAIGRALGVSHTTASKYLHAALAEVQAETKALATRAREVELQRLDVVLRKVWPKVMAGEVRAGELVLKVSERRAKLLGLEQPEQQQHSGRVVIEYVNDWRARPESEEAGRGCNDAST